MFIEQHYGGLCPILYVLLDHSHRALQRLLGQEPALVISAFQLQGNDLRCSRVGCCKKVNYAAGIPQPPK